MNRAHLSRLCGATLLIAGTTIGAGMLALPIATGRAGFGPSVIAMLFCWLYLTYAAFCLLEVNLAIGTKGNIISMASETLGKWGKWVSWVAYLFLLYSLNTAYVAVSTTIFQSFVIKATGYNAMQLLCALPLLLVFALLLKQGMKVIDRINRLMMLGLILAFIPLLYFCFGHVDTEHLKEINLRFAVSSLSTIVTAFGFHIVIPSLVTYLNGNVKELKIAIWVGSFIPLVAYILWQIAILGLVPVEGPVSITEAHLSGISGSDLIMQVTDHPVLPYLAQSFALFVILTSFLGVSLSLFDFLTDGFKTAKRSANIWKLFFFTFVPPLYFALTYPRAFFKALEYAGAYGVVVLLALIPALMVWRKRYVLKLQGPYQVTGGKTGLLLVIGISLLIIIFETLLKLQIVA